MQKGCKNTLKILFVIIRTNGKEWSLLACNQQLFHYQLNFSLQKII
jgi:hypothetical protein